MIITLRFGLWRALLDIQLRSSSPRKTSLPTTPLPAGVFNAS